MSWNFSTRKLRIFGEIKAGSDGPIYMFFIPKAKSVSKMHTAFCSYQESTKVNGNSLTLHLKASAKAEATLIAL